MTVAAAAPTSIPGPVDRVHFEDEQRRYRRKSWRFSVFAAFAALTTGIPACVIVTPVIYALALLVAYIINVVAFADSRSASTRGASARSTRARPWSAAARRRSRTIPAGITPARIAAPTAPSSARLSESRMTVEL